MARGMSHHPSISSFEVPRPLAPPQSVAPNPVPSVPRPPSSPPQEGFLELSSCNCDLIRLSQALSRAAQWSPPSGGRYACRPAITNNDNPQLFRFCEDNLVEMSPPRSWAETALGSQKAQKSSLSYHPPYHSTSHS
ncbi:hypothetical protein Nepgr_002718 [Nepenthes gracilis]|uniref:Uncharacterized protein n=1 Tax=Nepenthes gracilis TaxID=150966 RepID=A0AAD3P9Y9_NEPGR|nr:hypothetical protein Nepgr_002718 [Nepenthes gracilis]